MLFIFYINNFNNKKLNILFQLINLINIELIKIYQGYN